MPLLFDSPISRKQFLKRSLQLTALSAFGTSYQWLEASDKPLTLHTALLADTHIKAYKSEQYRGFFPYKNMKQVLEQIGDINPELMIINGDVARLDGQLGDYIAIKEMISGSVKSIPSVMSLGNHDDRENFYNIFGQKHDGRKEIFNKHVLVLERSDMQFIILDSLMYVNKTPGLLGREQRDWLGRFLEESDDRPVFIFFHHTPYDGDGDLLDSDRLFDILIRHNNVKAVFYGHSHVYRFGQRDHIQLINLPAVGYNFSDNQPVGWIEAWIDTKKGRFKLHAIGGNTEKNGVTEEIIWN